MMFLHLTRFIFIASCNRVIGCKIQLPSQPRLEEKTSNKMTPDTYGLGLTSDLYGIRHDHHCQRNVHYAPAQRLYHQVRRDRPVPEQTFLSLRWHTGLTFDDFCRSNRRQVIDPPLSFPLNARRPAVRSRPPGILFRCPNVKKAAPLRGTAFHVVLGQIRSTCALPHGPGKRRR